MTTLIAGVKAASVHSGVRNRATGRLGDLLSVVLNQAVVGLKMIASNGSPILHLMR